jgi:CRP-like cAMP-binding protein
MREILSFSADVPERTVAAGETILREGERSGVLFILVTGSVEVLRGDIQVNTGRSSARCRCS